MIYTLFQQSGDNLIWLQTKLVTYIDNDMNTEAKNDINHRSNHRERKNNSDNYIKTQYGRVIRKPDRLT